MTITIYFVIYAITISILAWFLDKSITLDVMKDSKDRWIYMKDFKKGDLINIPIEAIIKSIPVIEK